MRFCSLDCAGSFLYRFTTDYIYKMKKLRRQAFNKCFASNAVFPCYQQGTEIANKLLVCVFIANELCSKNFNNYSEETDHLQYTMY